MNQQQSHRPQDHAGAPASGDSPDASEKLEAVRKEAASARDIGKAHLAKVMSNDPNAYNQQVRQRSGQ